MAEKEYKLYYTWQSQPTPIFFFRLRFSLYLVSLENNKKLTHFCRLVVFFQRLLGPPLLEERIALPSELGRREVMGPVGFVKKRGEFRKVISGK